jgi:FixJ family two-component response regulator
MATDDAIVYVVDDDLSVRQALSSVIRSVGLHVETFASAQEFVRHAPADAPACIVLDVQLPDGSGLDLVRELEAADGSLPVIFITGHGTIPMSVRAMKAGALEFLTKPFQEEDLLAAIHQALEHDRAARAERATTAAFRERLAILTRREHDVLALIVAGRMNKQIAAELGTVEQTIKQHRGRVMQKLGVKTVAELVRLVERASGGASATGGRDAARVPILPR